MSTTSAVVATPQDVFVSYSRKNKEFALTLAQALNERGHKVWIDLDAIPPSAEWWAEIKRGIDAAHTFVPIVTPELLSSPVCTFEMNYALEQNKRIIPLMRNEAAKAQAFGAIAAIEPTGFLAEISGGADLLDLARSNWRVVEKLNWIMIRETDDFDTALDTFIRAVDTDLERVRLHARLLIRAHEWDLRGRDAGYLLVGAELREAESWLTVYGEQDPRATPEQRAFITVSREAEDVAIQREKQRDLMIRRFRVAALSLGVFAILAIMITVGLGLFSANAVRTANSANTQVAEAGQTIAPIPVTLTAVADAVLQGQNIIRAQQYAANATRLLQSDSGNTETAALLSIVALRLAYIPEADAALVHAVDRMYSSKTLFGHDGAVNAIAYSPDGGSLFSGGQDQTLRQWDVQSGEMIQQWALDGVPYSIAFTPDGKTMLIASTSNEVQIRDGSTGEATGVLSGHTGQVRAVAVSPDGRLAVTASEDRTLRVWDIANRESLSTLSGHTDAVLATSFSPDGQWIVSGTANNELWLWNTRSYARHLVFNTEFARPINSVAFTPDNRFVVTSSVDGFARLYEISTGAEVRRFAPPASPTTESASYGSPIYSVAVSPDGNTFAAGHGDIGGTDNSVRLWSLETGELIQTFTGHTDLVTTVAYAPDGGSIASGSGGFTGSDNSVRIWQLGGSSPLTQLDAWRFAMAANAPLMLVNDREGVSLWDMETETQVRQLSTEPSYGALALSPDGQYAITAAQTVEFVANEVQLWDVALDIPLTTLAGHTADVTSAAFSPDGTLVATAGGTIASNLTQDTTIRLWAVPSGELRASLTGHTDVVKKLLFMGDGRYLLSASYDGTVRRWDTTNDSGQVVFNGFNIWDIALSPDERYVLVGEYDTDATLLDTQTWEVVQVFRGHTNNSISSVAFSPDEKHVLTGASGLTQDFTIRIWDLETGSEVRRLTGHTNDISQALFIRSGTRVLSADSTGRVRLWHTDYIEYLDEVCQRLPRTFTDTELVQYHLSQEPAPCP